MTLLSIISGIAAGAATTAVMKGVMHTSTPVAIAGGAVTGTAVGAAVNGISKATLNSAQESHYQAEELKSEINSTVDEFSNQTEESFSTDDSNVWQKLSYMSEEISEEYEEKKKAEREAREAEFREYHDKVIEKTNREILENREVQREKFRKELDAKVEDGSITSEDRDAILAQNDKLWDQQMSSIDKTCKRMFPEFYK